MGATPTTEKFKLYAVSELLKIGGPTWLISNLFSKGSLVGMYGPSGEGKTFLALDWALSVASGAEWVGRSVQQGAVVYVAAEGGRSIQKRVSAWMLERACDDVPDAFFLLESVQVTNEEEIDLLINRIEALGLAPDLIVLDTLARCFVGGEENSAMEMGQFVEGVERLRRKTGAAVMVLHHTGKNGNARERGSTALRGAADVMIHVSKDQSRSLVIVENNKQKDDEEFPNIRLRLKQVALVKDGEADTSCVLEGAQVSAGRDGLSVQLKNTLSALAASPKEALTSSEWLARAGLKERTFHTHRKALVRRGLAKELQRGIYTVTDEGLAVLETAATANGLHLVSKR